MEDNTTIIERLWDTNSLTVYGILVVCLFIFNVFQWRRNQALVDILIEQQKEVLPTYSAVLAALKTVTEDVTELKGQVLDKLLQR